MCRLYFNLHHLYDCFLFVVVSLSTFSILSSSSSCCSNKLKIIKMLRSETIFTLSVWGNWKSLTSPRERLAAVMNYLPSDAATCTVIQNIYLFVLRFVSRAKNFFTATLFLLCQAQMGAMAVNLRKRCRDR